jgi:hypothetical protein
MREFLSYVQLIALLVWGEAYLYLLIDGILNLWERQRRNRIRQ